MKVIPFGYGAFARRRFRFIVLCAAALIFVTAQPGQAALSDKTSGSGAWWKKCVVLRDDRARLACFDSSVPGDDDGAANPHPSVNTAAPSPSASEPPSVSLAQPPSNPPAAARAISYRIATGYGLGIGGHAGSFEIEGGKLYTHSGIGSEGDTLTLQGWADNWIADDWSMGFEYLYVNNTGKLDLSMPNGVSVLTDPVTAHAHADVHGHIGFANIAYRPEQDSILHPYIGLGLGMGWGSAHIDAAAENAFAGSYHYESKTDSIFIAVQGFLAMDVFLYRDYYISPYGKVLWVPGHPYNLDQRYLDFVFGASIGHKF